GGAHRPLKRIANDYRPHGVLASTAAVADLATGCRQPATGTGRTQRPQRPNALIANLRASATTAHATGRQQEIEGHLPPRVVGLPTGSFALFHVGISAARESAAAWLRRNPH